MALSRLIASGWVWHALLAGGLLFLPMALLLWQHAQKLEHLDRQRAGVALIAEHHVLLRGLWQNDPVLIAQQLNHIASHHPQPMPRWSAMRDTLQRWTELWPAMQQQR